MYRLDKQNYTNWQQSLQLYRGRKNTILHLHFLTWDQCTDSQLHTGHDTSIIYNFLSDILFYEPRFETVKGKLQVKVVYVTANKCGTGLQLSTGEYKYLTYSTNHTSLVSVDLYTFEKKTLKQGKTH